MPTPLVRSSLRSSLARPTFSGLVGHLLLLVVLTGAYGQTPSFGEATVHDPSIVRDGEMFYIFGSHLASASSADLLHWNQLSTTPTAGNPLVPNPTAEFAEAIAWVAGDYGFWAPDVIRLPDGRYAYYYCVGRLDQPRAALGIAFSGQITGPYVDAGVFLRSGPGGQPPEAGAVYDARIHPNTIDPALFFDAEGDFWMVYGSYSGGIFILAMDPGTGLPLPGQGYGKKLIGGNHARIEGAYVLHSPESGYYYLFVSYGGLGAADGYNLRVGRSRAPDGPYVDAAGTDLATVAGAPGSLFDDASIAPHGVKLMGAYQFLAVAGEPRSQSRGYVSPGHNSAYYDASSGKYFLVFHTRFVGRGEQHEVRVHQMFLNQDDWLVAAPHRYAGETLQRTDLARVVGRYKFINHGKGINRTATASTVIELHANGSLTGDATGTWRLEGETAATLAIGGETYRGVFLRQWDDDQQVWVRAFTALSSSGTAIWGSKVATHVPEPAPVITAPPLAVRARVASTVALTAEASGAETYQWRRDGQDLPGATSEVLVLPDVRAADAGSYSVLVRGVDQVTESEAVPLTLVAAGSSSISNLSVRTDLAAGGNLIVGFYSAGESRMLMRAVGPSLADVAPGLTGLHPDPRIELFDGPTRVAENEDWFEEDPPLAPAFGPVGAFALRDDGRDAALLRSVAGARTAHIRGPGSGILLVEVYHAGGDGHLINVSARNRVGVGANVLIAGFVIAGDVAQTVLVRGLGPRLAELGVPDVLANPQLAIFDANGRRLAGNDNWNDALSPLAQRTGANGLPLAPSVPDAGLVVTLNPGAYTVVVSGAGDTSGEGLIEVYPVP